MTSTESSPEATATSPQTPEQAAQDALTFRQGLKRLLAMEAIESFAESFDWERDEVAAQAALDRGAMNGQAASSPSAAASKDNDMKLMVGGNLVVQPRETKPQPAAGQPPTQQPTQPLTANPWLAPLAAGLLGAVLAAGGGAIYNNMGNLQAPPPAADQSDWKLGVDVTDRPEQ